VRVQTNYVVLYLPESQWSSYWARPLPKVNPPQEQDRRLAAIHNSLLGSICPRLRAGVTGLVLVDACGSPLKPANGAWGWGCGLRAANEPLGPRQPNMSCQWLSRLEVPGDDGCHRGTSALVSNGLMLLWCYDSLILSTIPTHTSTSPFVLKSSKSLNFLEPLEPL